MVATGKSRLTKRSNTSRPGYGPFVCVSFGAGQRVCLYYSLYYRIAVSYKLYKLPDTATRSLQDPNDAIAQFAACTINLIVVHNLWSSRLPNGQMPDIQRCPPFRTPVIRFSLLRGWPATTCPLKQSQPSRFVGSADSTLERVWSPHCGLCRL